VECALAGTASIAVINRNTRRGEALAEVIRQNTKADTRFIPWDGPARVPEGTDIVINATCVGLHPHGDECPDVDFDSIQPGMVACDVIFNPVDTPFLSRCAQRGAHTIDGLGMLVNQGAINYTLWTKRKAPRDVMYAKLKAEFGM
jgi:shikimate dehydrogenase